MLQGETRNMKKQYSALLVAFVVTICIAAGMLLVSASALLNKNGLPVANSPAQATATAQVKTAEEAQIQQLQNLVTQYQTREAKYQGELSSAGQQLQQANDQLRQYQMLLAALQNRGYITIESNGQILVQ
jgi:peptidoglycan hydrolase CwlO-like protein